MKLSVIIVNYNTKELLGQCLHSVKAATAGMESEIIVVDNNSADNSRKYLSSTVGVRSIFNPENRGFAKACNQGYKISSGKYVLFLNPDTVVSAGCFDKCIAFLESHAGAGAAGVRMIDEKGRYLKESKRGFPTPAASFYKLFGFAKIFPRSKKFTAYYAGHLPDEQNNPVEVLSGAFMMVKKEVLEITGGFDESFFMYGEDIDLSYRIQQSGYKSYYLGEVTILHRKGGSTAYNYKYVKTFYDAMWLFVKKHYAGKKPFFIMWLLYSGIWFRKMIAVAGLPFR